MLIDDTGSPVVNEVFIYPDNLAAWDLFIHCQTQWQLTPQTGEPLGLNYPGVETTARLRGINLTPDLFDDIQHIELGALGRQSSTPELDALHIVRVEFDDGETI